jgi:two-component system sensor histidine kinase UhpB
MVKNDVTAGSGQQLSRVETLSTTGRGAGGPRGNGSSAPRQFPSAFGPLLRLPLFYKLIIANVTILLVAVLTCTALVATSVRADPGAASTAVVLPVAIAGAALSALVNALVVRLALQPLHRLEETARRVQQGEHEARVLPSALADRELEQLTTTFNAMLDSVAEYRHRSRELAVHALEAGESERKRIAAELHDGIAQSLAALLLQLRLIRSAAEPAERNELLQRAADELAAVTEELRAIARGLRPPALDMLGLVAAVTAHARLLAEHSNIRLEVRGDDLNHLLSAPAELAFYRLVQEALANVVRHSGARSATLDLSRNDGVVSATVRDDGRGFRVDEALASGRGLGLFGMHERASYAGGHVHVISQPGSGTTVRIEFPVDGTKAHV